MAVQLNNVEELKNVPFVTFISSAANAHVLHKHQSVSLGPHSACIRRLSITDGDTHNMRTLLHGVNTVREFTIHFFVNNLVRLVIVAGIH